MNVHMIQLIIGACCIGFAPIFVRLSTMEPTVSAFYRCFIAALVLISFNLITNLKDIPNQLRKIFNPTYLIPGAIFSFDLFVWHKAIIYCGAGMSTLLANTQVFYLALIGRFFFKEPLKWPYLIFVIFSFFGIFLLVQFNGGQSQFENYELGVYLGLATGLIYSSYLLAMRWTERSIPGANIFQKIAGISLSSSLFLFLLSLAEGQDLKIEGMNYLWALGLAVVPQIMGWVLITRSIAMIEVTVSGLIILLQPIVAFVLAYLLLGEDLNSTQCIGIAFAISGIFAGERYRRTIRTSN